MDVRVQEQVQRHGLIDVPGNQAPDFLVHQVVLVQVLDDQLVVGEVHHLADEAHLIDDEFIDVQLRQLAFPLEDMFGRTLPLNSLHFLDGVPEGVGEFPVALGQKINVIEQLVVVVVLSFDAEAPCLEAHVNVFRHQDNVPGLVAVLESSQGVDDLVVVQMLWQRMVATVTGAHQDRKSAQGFGLLATHDGNTFLDHLRAGIAQQLIDVADGLTAVSGHGLLAGFEAVEFFEDRHRDDDIVFFKVEEGVRVVDQDVGVEDVHLSASLRCSGHKWRYLSGGSVVIGAALREFLIRDHFQHIVSRYDAGNF